MVSLPRPNRWKTQKLQYEAHMRLVRGEFFVTLCAIEIQVLL